MPGSMLAGMPEKNASNAANPPRRSANANDGERLLRLCRRRLLSHDLFRLLLNFLRGDARCGFLGIFHTSENERWALRANCLRNRLAANPENLEGIHRCEAFLPGYATAIYQDSQQHLQTTWHVHKSPSAKQNLFRLRNTSTCLVITPIARS